MSNKLFVGGIPYAVGDEELAEFFAQAGTVVSAKVIMDKMTGRSRGFGFVEMSSEEEAKKAIEEFNGADVDGRKIVVNIAQPPREDRGPRRDDRRGGGRY